MKVSVAFPIPKERFKGVLGRSYKGIMKNFDSLIGLCPITFLLDLTVDEINGLRDRSVEGTFYFIELISQHLKFITHTLYDTCIFE